MGNYNNNGNNNTIDIFSKRLPVMYGSSGPPLNTVLERSKVL